MTRKTLSLKLPEAQPSHTHKLDDVTPVECNFCRFYESADTTCRKRPPYHSPDGAGQWPRVADHQWCGEYRRLPHA
jgi:hypothetical protein